VVYSGQTCWRAVVSAPPLPGGVEALGAHGHRFGLVPLAGDRAYIFLVSHAPAHADPPPWEALQARFGAFGGLPAQVWPGVRPDDLLHHDLSALSAPVWGTPRAWLLGDAAHAMTPNLGQGAAMAIEDAAALALALGPDLPAAHARYVADRHRRVVRMQANSDRVGRVNAARHPITRWLRDAVLRSTPDWVAARVQRGVVNPGIALAARWAG
jgi:2-polyprenyl-6-methoxyphenol hydroxylase-like FAD-dependent oxidoreductase